MKLPVNDTLKNIFGEPLLAPAGDDQQPTPMTLALVAQNALLGSLKGDENLDGSGKLTLYQLATKTADPNADYSVEEVSDIKKRIGRAYGPVVVGPAWAMIEAAGKANE